jgi:hypothetical protein
MHNEDFQQEAQTTKHSDSFCLKLPIAHQLALTLEQLGSNGNGASVGQFSRNLCVGQGTAVKASCRNIRAINDLSDKD